MWYFAVVWSAYRSPNYSPTKTPSDSQFALLDRVSDAAATAEPEQMEKRDTRININHVSVSI
jgi:hypothetical protein